MRIPIAINDKSELCSPTIAEKGSPYFCPVCNSQVILKKGDVKVAHFAHKISETCNSETVTHKTATLLIKKVVSDWKSGLGAAPALERECQICEKPMKQPLPDKVDATTLEYKMSDGSIVDIALLVGEVAQAVIEIRVSKTEDVIVGNSPSLPFMELDGFEVVKNPNIWKPLRDGLLPFTCESCNDTYEKFRSRVEEIARTNHLALPATYYRYGFCTCWKCNREIIVFAWPGDSMQDDARPRGNPLPATIQYRYSKTAKREYWVNTCQYCNEIQGDFFLYYEPEGPFFALEIEADTPSAFKRDLAKIAANARYVGLV